MILAAVVTPWIGDGLSPETSNRSQLASDHSVVSVRDITGQPTANLRPDPNEYTVAVVCDQATLDAIEADPTYEVLWSEEIPEPN